MRVIGTVPTPSEPAHEHRVTHPSPAPARRGVPPGGTQEQRLLLEYQSNGGNGTKAYQATHPLCRSANAAAVHAWHLLRKAKIVAALEASRKERWERLKMDADEALARISISARADIGQALAADGTLLPVSQWPDSLRLAVKSFKPGPFGDTVVPHDGLRAAELMGVAGGKLKGTLILQFDHAKYLGSEPPKE